MTVCYLSLSTCLTVCVMHVVYMQVVLHCAHILSTYRFYYIVHIFHLLTGCTTLCTYSIYLQILLHFVHILPTYRFSYTLEHVHLRRNPSPSIFRHSKQHDIIVHVASIFIRNSSRLSDVRYRKPLHILLPKEIECCFRSPWLANRVERISLIPNI